MTETTYPALDVIAGRGKRPVPYTETSVDTVR